MAPWDILVFGLCAALAAFTQSISGFGFGILLVGLLPVLGFPLLDVVVMIGILVIPNLALGLWRVRRHCSLKRIGWVLVGIPVGVPLGIWLQDSGSEALVRGLLGSVLIFAALEPYFRGDSEPRPTGARWALAAGAASGVLGAAFATGGPPLVIYYYRRRWSKQVTKAALLLTYVVTVATRTVPYVWKGWLTLDLLCLAAAFCPVVFAASFVGEHVFHRVSQQGFRKVLAAMLVLLGLYQLAKAAGAW